MLDKLYNISAVYPFYNHTGLSDTDRQTAGCIACCRIQIRKPRLRQFLAGQDYYKPIQDTNIPTQIVLERTEPGKAVFKVQYGYYEQPWYITWTKDGTCSGTFLVSCYMQLTAQLPAYTGSSLILLNQCMVIRTPGVVLHAASDGIQQTGGIYPNQNMYTNVKGFCDGYNCQVSAQDSNLIILSSAAAGKGRPKYNDVWGSDSQDSQLPAEAPTGVRTINTNTGSVTFLSIGDVTQNVVVTQQNDEVTTTVQLSI